MCVDMGGGFTLSRRERERDTIFIVDVCKQ